MNTTDTASWAISSYCRPGTESRSRAFAVKPADTTEIARKGALFAVVDGSISPTLPDKAAELVGQTLLRLYYSSETGRDPQIALRMALQRAVAALESIRPPGSAPLAVAVAAGVVWQNELLLARVGDAAALLMRNDLPISLSPEPPDFDSILESSLPLMPGDRVALSTAGCVAQLPVALSMQDDVAHAAHAHRNAVAAAGSIPHGALALFDQPHVHPPHIIPPPTLAPAVEVDPIPTPPPPPVLSAPQKPAPTEPESPAAENEPAPEPPPTPQPLLISTQTSTPEPAANEQAAAPPAPQPSVAPPAPAPKPRKRRRFPLLPLLLVAAIAGAALYFNLHPDGPAQFAFARTQAESAANTAIAYVAHTISGEQPVVVVVESPLPTPTTTAATNGSPTATLAVNTPTLAPTLTPTPTSTLTPTSTPTPAPTLTPTPTSTPTPTPTPTPMPTPTPQSIGEVVREVASPTAVRRLPTTVPTADRRPSAAAPTTTPTTTPTAAPTAVPTAAPTTTPEGQLPSGPFPTLPPPPP